METNIYFKEANELFKRIIDYIEELDEGVEDLVFNEEIIQFEIHNAEFAGKERRENLKFIINKHAVLKEIWLASPLSGPLHFKYDTERKAWIDREKVEIFAVLKKDLKELKLLV